MDLSRPCCIVAACQRRGGSHGSQTPHRPQLLRSRRNGVNPSHPKPGSRPVRKPFMGTSNSSKNSGATTPAPAVPGGGFKNCCLQSGRHDGIERDYYF